MKGKEPTNSETKKHKKSQLPMKENYDKNETFSKSERKKFSDYRQHYDNSTTNFKEVADRKKRNEGCCSILPPSNSNSPFSWYIPSDPPSRSNSNNSDKPFASRQNSIETPVTPPPTYRVSKV